MNCHVGLILHHVVCFCGVCRFLKLTFLEYQQYQTVCIQIRPNKTSILIEPWHGISNNVVCANSKASDQPARMRSLIRTFASCLNIL